MIAGCAGLAFLVGSAINSPDYGWVNIALRVFQYIVAGRVGLAFSLGSAESHYL